MELDHHVDPVAHRRTDLLEGREGRLQPGGRDVLARARLGRGVERPDLHRGDAALQQFRRQFVRPGEKPVEIVVRRARQIGDAVIRGDLPLAAPHVGGAGAGVVGADALPREPAEQLRDRQTGGLTEQVPQRDVEGGVAAGLDPGRAEPQIPGQLLGQKVDRQRIAADHPRGEALVHIGLDGLRQKERLAQPGQPLVGMHQQPDQVRRIGDPDGLDRGDLHLSRSPRRPAP